MITVAHVPLEDRIAAVLGIPSRVTQLALLPVAHTCGLAFRAAPRLPARQTTYWNRWGITRRRRMTATPDVVVVGGGIAGAATALALARRGVDVVVLEFQDAYRDLVRGEMLSPWGVAEAERMGVADAVFAAGPSRLRQWVHWDEIYMPEEAPVFDLTQPFVPGIEGPLAIHHYRTCQAMAERAVAAGVHFVFGARGIQVTPGTSPTVVCRAHDDAITLSPRLVIGAGGRHGPVGRQVGLHLETQGAPLGRWSRGAGPRRVAGRRAGDGK